MTMSDLVRTEQHGATLVITLDRPRARNAVNREVSLAMAGALDLHDSDDGLVVAIITGAGGNFCSGMDLKAFAAGERPARMNPYDPATRELAAACAIEARRFDDARRHIESLTIPEPEEPRHAKRLRAVERLVGQ